MRKDGSFLRIWPYDKGRFRRGIGQSEFPVPLFCSTSETTCHMCIPRCHLLLPLWGNGLATLKKFIFGATIDPTRFDLYRRHHCNLIMRLMEMTNCNGLPPWTRRASHHHQSREQIQRRGAARRWNPARDHDVSLGLGDAAPLHLVPLRIAWRSLCNAA